MRLPAASLIVPAAAALAVAAGCGGQAAAPSTPVVGDLVLLRPGAERTLVLGGGTADAPGRALPAGQPTLDGRRLYTATASGGATVVSMVEVASGRALRTTRLAGRWMLPATVSGGPPDALSASGSTLVLARADGAGSSFALLDASLRQVPHVVTLPGRFAFDAVSPEAGLLFLIEHQGAAHYQVRAYDLARDRLRAQPIVDKAEPDEKMEGLPTARATSADGTWVYTLYRRPDQAPFIHALQAADGYALCIDLPRGTRSGAAAAAEWGLALSPNAPTLYAANPALGLVLALDVGDVGVVRRAARVPRGAIGAPPRLALAPDGATLYVPTADGVVPLDADTLAAHGRMLAGRRVSAVVAAGHRLYAQDGAIVALDASTGRVLQRTATAAPPAALAAVVQAR
jgi:hypothetical protein